MSMNTGGDDGRQRAIAHPSTCSGLGAGDDDARRVARASRHADEKKRADNRQLDTMDGEGAVPLARCLPALAQTGARQ
jgi:hypothetical protein